MRRIDDNTRKHAKSLEITRNRTQLQPYQVQVGAQIHMETCFSPQQWAQHPKNPYTQLVMQTFRLEMENGAN